MLTPSRGQLIPVTQIALESLWVVPLPTAEKAYTTVMMTDAMRRHHQPPHKRCITSPYISLIQNTCTIYIDYAKLG